MKNLLFVCSRNEWRSRTAEKIYRNSEKYKVRSAGTASSARKKVSRKDLEWADIVFVMENKHRSKIIGQYNDQTIRAKIIVLDIADHYQFMDEELIEIFNVTIPLYLT